MVFGESRIVARKTDARNICELKYEGQEVDFGLALNLRQQLLFINNSFEGNLCKVDQISALVVHSHTNRLQICEAIQANNFGPLKPRAKAETHGILAKAKSLIAC